MKAIKIFERWVAGRDGMDPLSHQPGNNPILQKVEVVSWAFSNMTIKVIGL